MAICCQERAYTRAIDLIDKQFMSVLTHESAAKYMVKSSTDIEKNELDKHLVYT